MNLQFSNSYWLLLVIIVTLLSIDAPLLVSAQPKKPQPLLEKWRALETSFSGRIGVYAINTANQKRFQYRGEERFPMGSTAKVIAVSAILKKSLLETSLLQKKVIYKKKDLASYSPLTKAHLTTGMTIGQLCEATITHSDNTAMNLLIKQLGGVSAVNAFARSIGDHQFRLDRLEPALNSAIPGDLRDTTTPQAMAKSLQKLVLGKVLGLAQREQLTTWLKNNTTGHARIRAGVPQDWVVGDKTGTSDYGTTNDISILWPPHGSPIIIAIYYTQTKKNAVPRDEIIAKATRILMHAFSGRA